MSFSTRSSATKQAVQANSTEFFEQIVSAWEQSLDPPSAVAICNRFPEIWENRSLVVKLLALGFLSGCGKESSNDFGHLNRKPTPISAKDLALLQAAANGNTAGVQELLGVLARS